MRVRYPADYNPIREYWVAIQSGEEVVSKKIRRTYAKIVRDLDEPGEWWYSPERANHLMEFAENYCRLIQGATGPVRLELWQKAMFATIFGFVERPRSGQSVWDVPRKYREALLIIGKKNGKSLMASIVGLYLLIADGEPGPEVYAVATKRDQAKKVWTVAKQMAAKSPSLRKRMRLLTHELICDFNDGFFKPLASDSNTMDGWNVHGVIMDEIHQWRNGGALYDIMADGITARDQPLILILTTAGKVREDIFDAKYDEATLVINGYEDADGYKDERFIAFVYELDKREEWTDRACWWKANPALGTIKKLNQLEAKVERAKKNSALVKNLVCKEFNIRENSSETWLTLEQIDNPEKFSVEDLKPRYGIGGVDLSSTTDLTAAVVIFRVPGDDRIYVLPMMWLPEELLDQRVKEDKVSYDLWYDQGLLRLTPGNKVAYRFVKDWFLEVKEKYDIYLPWIGYDRWMAEDWVDEMRRHFGKNSMIPIAQGAQTLSTPMKILGADLTAKKVIYNDHKILRWNLTNVSCIEDSNTNIKPCKSSNPRKRIDGLSALLDAYVVLNDKYIEYENLIGG